jgi:hypothetical protein
MDEFSDSKDSRNTDGRLSPYKQNRELNLPKHPIITL